MIVNNLYVRWPQRPAWPLEANPPLIVDADGVLAFAVADQSFEAITGQSGQVSERGGCLQTIELQARGALKSRKGLDAFARGKISGPIVPIADNHRPKMPLITCYVKRNGEMLVLSVLLEIVGGLGKVGGAAEVAPVVGVGAEGEDGLALGGEAEVGGDDGEDAFFCELGEEAGGDQVDAGEGEGLERT